MTIAYQNSRYMKTSNFDCSRPKSLFKRYKAVTIISYAMIFTNFYFLLLHAHELFFFVYESKEYLQERLQPLSLEVLLNNTKLRALSKLCQDLLTDYDRLASVLEALVKLTVFNWSEPVHGGRHFKPQLNYMNKIRRTLDSLNFFSYKHYTVRWGPGWWWL